MPVGTSSKHTARRRDRRTRAAREEGADARAMLLGAAAEVFARRGYDGASMDEIARCAGYSKGALYWHFDSKDELFFALMDQSVDAPAHEMIELLHAAPPEQDMAPEASRRMAELVAGQRELLLLDNEYWGQAVRDPKLAARYATRREQLRAALGKALQARLEHLGAGGLEIVPDELATIVMSLTTGLAQERLIDPSAVPRELLGRAIVLMYRGLIADATDKPPPIAPSDRGAEPS
jgi:AcrR family transcriptional regulator